MNRSSCSSPSQQVERRQHQQSPQERMRKLCVEKPRSNSCRLSSAAERHLLGRNSTSCQFLGPCAHSLIFQQLKSALTCGLSMKSQTRPRLGPAFRICDAPQETSGITGNNGLGHPPQLLLQLGRLNFGLSRRDRRPSSMQQCPHLSVIASCWT